MAELAVLNRCLSEALGVDFERVAPGEIRVVRSLKREKAVERPDGVALQAPVWILVAKGRGVVATSRFLQQIVAAWAESFAAPEHLLNPVFQKDLLDAVERAQDAPVTVIRQRILVPDPAQENVEQFARTQSPHVSFPELDVELSVISSAIFRDDTDRAGIREVLDAGGAEYGRLVRLVIQR